MGEKSPGNHVIAAHAEQESSRAHLGGHSCADVGDYKHRRHGLKQNRSSNAAGDLDERSLYI